MGTTAREFESQRVFPFDGREAMRSILRAKLDGVPLQYDILVMKKDGCLYDLVYVAPPDRFATALVEAVEENLERIDALVSAASVDWELSRMPVVDLSVLRIAVAELISWPETPVAVILDEAVELAKQFSTEESGGFVNGVLSTVAGEVRKPPAP